ncbi:hypothetical protein ACFCXR_01660 [Streptomyces noursei]|uniref:hypothetical protein n=1 Tax=Streptomyces noursei TaxID=1971 RepID=UPI001F3D9A8C|nr:hypothetical protein [Streptomyces noursei]MCE4943160.1 hypothetical protein [Streptomyces noursei]
MIGSRQNARTVPPAEGALLEPVPVPGCDVCRALAGQRELARAAGSTAVVRSRNAEIKCHPHQRTAARSGAGQFFVSPEEIAIGSVVYDRDSDMVGTVCGAAGILVRVERPTHLTWETPYTRLRPGTEWEKKQLAALARLQRDRERGRS